MTLEHPTWLTLVRTGLSVDAPEDVTKIVGWASAAVIMCAPGMAVLPRPTDADDWWTSLMAALTVFSSARLRWIGLRDPWAWSAGVPSL